MLKVLIAYHEDDYGGKDSAKGGRQEYLPRLRHEVAETGHKTLAMRKLEFLLVLGDEVTEDPAEWYGFSLGLLNGNWDPFWTEL